MAKAKRNKGRHPKGGRVTPKGARPLGQGLRSVPPPTRVAEPDLLGDVHHALRRHPLELLAQASSLLATTEDRSPPLGPLPTQELPTVSFLVQTFIEVDQLETTALLAVLAELTGDEVLATRCRREVTRRRHPIPAWIDGLATPEVTGVVEQAHVLGDGDNVMVGIGLPGGHDLTAVVYIDHNAGTVVKDAFVLPDRLDVVLDTFRAHLDADTTVADLDPADARARITEAVDHGARLFPPLETDTWPACRALVRWVAGLLPQGGTGYLRPEWTDDDLQDLARRFLASPFGDGLAGNTHTELLDHLLWFATGYGPGDPLRWSPVAVEIVLCDWIPRKIVADVADLTDAPRVLRAFIAFCHAERGIGSGLTDQTLAAVDHHEPEYQQLIRSRRPQGPMAILAALGAFDPDGPWGDDGDGEDMDNDWDDEDDDWDESWSYKASTLEWLGKAVGGPGALAVLDTDPLPDEPFDWDGIAPDIHDRVAEVLALCDNACEALLDVEHRTACRRVLTRVAAGDPKVFRRAGRADTAAAAICWAVAKANDTFGSSSAGLTAKALLAHLGLATSSMSQRATTLLKAGGFSHPGYGPPNLGAAYLTARRRQHIADRRDRLEAMDDE